jgi:hypothetical protein
MVITRDKSKTSSANNQPPTLKSHRRLEEYAVDSFFTVNSLKRMTEIREASEQTDKFDGNDNENVEQRLERVDIICDCFNDISDKDNMKRIPTRLGSGAFLWLNENRQK